MVLLSQYLITGHYQLASERLSEWRFAGGPIMTRFYVLIGKHSSTRTSCIRDMNALARLRVYTCSSGYSLLAAMISTNVPQCLVLASMHFQKGECNYITLSHIG